MIRVLSGEVRLLRSDAEPLGAVDWWVGETRQGWTGMATCNPDPESAGRPVAETIFQRAIELGAVPGAPVQFGLWGRAAHDYQLPSSEEEAEFVRSWPSVVTAVHAPCELKLRQQEHYSGKGSMVLFCDPVTYLLKSRVWGVFKDRTPGELLAGGLLLASGAQADPSLQPVIPGLPPIAIADLAGGADAARVPYAIAAGETLGAWLGAIFGRLGVRMEMLGGEDGTLHVSILQGEPAGQALDMRLGDTPAPDTVAVSSFQMGPTPPDIDGSTLIDNPSLGLPRRVGQSRRISRVDTAQALTLDEATERAGRLGDPGELYRNVIETVTEQPGLHAGRIVNFDRTIAGAGSWQVHKVEHMTNAGKYINMARLLKLGAWTPPTPPDRGTVIVGGVVYDPDIGEDFGQTVERDEVCRVPVRLMFSQGDPVTAAAEDENAGNGSAAGQDAESPAPPAPELALSVIGPMAGGAHGFVPAHRQGDICAVAVHHPMSAEIVGFSFAGHRSIGEDMVDVSMGLVAQHGGQDWAGIVFRPLELVAKDKEKPH